MGLWLPPSPGATVHPVQSTAALIPHSCPHPLLGTWLTLPGHQERGCYPIRVLAPHYSSKRVRGPARGPLGRRVISLSLQHLAEGAGVGLSCCSPHAGSEQQRWCQLGQADPGSSPSGLWGWRGQ